MFGLPVKCPVCKMEIKKGKGISRFGKVFCSEECAKEYGKQQAKKQK
ncbi:MAG: hypothetical protein WA139_02890 [Candidatus Aenigmatarchaeota archaeon]